VPKIIQRETAPQRHHPLGEQSAPADVLHHRGLRDLQHDHSGIRVLAAKLVLDHAESPADAAERLTATR